MQPQRDIRIFSCIFCGLFDGDVVKGDLFCTLTGNLFEGDNPLTKIFKRQAAHIVATSDCVQYIGLEHSVVRYTAQRNAVVSKHIRIVLEMLTYLLYRS